MLFLPLKNKQTKKKKKKTEISPDMIKTRAGSGMDAGWLAGWLAGVLLQVVGGERRNVMRKGEPERNSVRQENYKESSTSGGGREKKRKSGMKT